MAVVIEWADRVHSLIPEEGLWVDLEPTGENSRRISFTATGEVACRCLEDLCAAHR